MLNQQDFLAIVKFHNLMPEIQLKDFLQSQGLIETNLSKGEIKVLSFQGDELDLSFKKAGLKSEIISQYLTLIDIGVAPESKQQNLYRLPITYKYKTSATAVKNIPQN